MPRARHSRPHRADGEPGARHVGGVGEHHRPDAGRQPLCQILRHQLPPLRAGQVLHLHPRPLQLAEGAQDGVVLHGGGHDPVAGPQQSLEQQIQPVGGPGGERHIARPGTVHQGAEPLPHLQHPPGRVIGPLVAAPADVAAHTLNVVRHSRPHPRCLGVRGGRVVQIYGAHV